MEALVWVGYLVGAFLIGSLPFSFVMARICSGADLRRVGSGTVSGTGVGRSSGFWPMALAGVLDIGKGAAAVIPVVADRPLLAALGAGAAVAGHNWSPSLRWAGGRGISTGFGAALVVAWPGLVVLAAGMAIGRLFRQTGLGCFVSQAALPVVLTITDGGIGVVLAGALVVPMWVKRVLGNGPPEVRRPRVYLSRLLFDNDEGLQVPETPPGSGSVRPVR
jgi:glycerol-3-phosphate acyltransferase PlsY